jgi:hypothetical protein
LETPESRAALLASYVVAPTDALPQEAQEAE